MLTVSDYQVRGEKRVYWEGVGGLIGITLFLAWDVLYFMVGPPVNSNIQPDAPLYGKWWIPLIMVAYPVLAWVVANWLAMRPRIQQLKEAGMNARVLSKNYPRVKTILAEQSHLLSMDEPEMYILEDDTPYIFSLPGKSGRIVASAPLLEAMNDEELAVMIAREMGHILCGHVRMTILVHFMRRAHIGLQVLLFPITALAAFLRGWVELTEFTADRLAVLVTGRPPLVNASLVKLAVAADREAEISREELDTYLEAGMGLSTDAEQIERHFKVGEFLSKQKSLRERIEEVREFPRSDEGQEAMQKMMELKQRLA